MMMGASPKKLGGLNAGGVKTRDAALDRAELRDKSEN